MASPRVFSIAEVEALIPTLNALVTRQLERHDELEAGLGQLARAVGGLPRTLSDDPGDAPKVAALKVELRKRIERYENGWADVTALGAVVKDPNVGLVDFYGRVDGRLVWFCWRLGEESLRYYHDLDADFSKRRALRPETRRVN
jgi:hypothetical protein